MDISGILSQVKSGGFVNPVSVGTQAALNSLTVPSLVELTALADAQALLHGTIAPTTLQLETAFNSVTNAVNKTQELIGHTDRISGVNLSGDGTLATIARTMQSAKNINGESSCATVLAAFGAIQNAAELVLDTINSINLIQSFLEDIVNQITNLPNVLDAYVNKVAQQIASDVGALAQAQLDIVQAAVAQNLTALFQDECTSQVLAAVMTQPMKNEVTKVYDAIKAKKLISINGK